MQKVSSDYLESENPKLFSKAWSQSLKYTEGSFRKKWLIRLFQAARIMADPVAHSNDRSAKIADMIDHRIEFFLVHDINRDFTKEQKLKWFGSEVVTAKHIAWDNLEKLLRPSNRVNAVYRVNDALEGDPANEYFSREKNDLAFYIPKTVTVYDSREQAETAAKMLRLMTRDSDRVRVSTATINTVNLSNGYLNGKWAIEDSMNLFTHNNLRRLMVHLFEKSAPSPKEHYDNEIKAITANRTAAIQKEVDRRLPKDEIGWVARQGVGTFLTLAGRPGVKMYAPLRDEQGNIVRDKKGRQVDDPVDIKRVGRLPHQMESRLTLGVPDSVERGPDGQLIPYDSIAELQAKTFWGIKLVQLFQRGVFRAPGELAVDWAKITFTNDYYDGSVFGGMYSVANIAYQTKSVIEDTVFKGIAVALATIITTPLLAFSIVCSTIYDQYKEVTETDPLNDLKAKVEKITGYSFTKCAFKKVWTHREMQKDIDPPSLHPCIAGVDFELEQAHEVLWGDRIKTKPGKKFADYLVQKDLLPSKDLLPADASTLPEIQSTTLQLAEIFGEYKLTALKFEHNRRFKRNGAHELCNHAHDLKASYDTTLMQLRGLLNQADKYPGNHHAFYLRDLPAKLHQGFELFVNEQVKSLTL